MFAIEYSLLLHNELLIAITLQHVYLSVRSPEKCESL
jgi:hypothetical protein